MSIARIHSPLLTLALVSCGGVAPEASSPVALASTDDALAAQAAGDDAELAERAIAALRRRGPAGLQALLSRHHEAVARLRTEPPLAIDGELERVRHAIDIVSGQRDGHASGLYWHTDLDAARRQAQREDRPILSLRLLGRLDEEMSCANSRFFRLALYADERVASYLRERYVLHWSSERPAPRITIDMGDGRTIVRTITGNSVHYVLEPSGRVADVLVGLYDAHGFLARLADATELERTCRGAPWSCIAAMHDARLAAQAAEWERRRAAGASVPSFTAMMQLAGERAGDDEPSATVAMPLTVAKAVIETPMLRMMQRGAALPPRAPATEPDWRELARGSRARIALGAGSVALLSLKMRERDVSAMQARLALTAVADGLRNEILFHARLHAWLRDAGEAPAFAALNERVYRELLRTPAGDPWLGLRADDLFDGIETASY